jgi:hypothetical protein
MRILIAALLGGVVTFFWGFVSHVLLPVGEMGMVVASDAAQDQVAAAMKSGFPGEGIYMVPGMDPKLMTAEAAMKTFGARATSMPQAFIVYQPQGRDIVNNMGPNLGIQFVTDTLGALVAAFIGAMIVGFGRRVQALTALGLFAWFTVSLPYWNWYRFPMAFTEGALIEGLVGAFLSGLVISWWLGRGER